MLELASSTLAMFSQRPAAGKALYDSGITTIAVKLLSPLLPTVSTILCVLSSVECCAFYMIAASPLSSCCLVAELFVKLLCDLLVCCRWL